MQFHVSTSPSSVWNFMSNCAHIHPDQWWMEQCYPITCLLTVRNTSVADCLDPEMAKQLHNEIFQYRSNTFSETTKTTYRTHRNSYLRFCQRMEYLPFPAQPAHICQYPAFLPRTLKATSIPNYLNIISILHKEFNLPNPLANYWALQSLLTDIKRVKGQPPAQKLPIIPDVLKKNYLPLNLRTSFDASFWAVCLVSFYGMLHKHHLLAGLCHIFDPSQQLVRSDFQTFPWGALVTIRWSKTIQFRKQVVQILLPLIPDSPLCPVIAIQRAFSFVPYVSPPTPRKPETRKNGDKTENVLDSDCQAPKPGFPSPAFGCVKVFDLSNAFEKHLDAGKHFYYIHKEGSYVEIKCKWVSRCSDVGHVKELTCKTTDLTDQERGLCQRLIELVTMRHEHVFAF